MDVPKVVIDPDIFHSLDHPIGGRYCREQQPFPRCLKLHWHYAWDYNWRMRVMRATACRVGAHERSLVRVKIDPAKSLWDTSNQEAFVSCFNCGKGLG
jgi:hypothetical protein